MRAEVLEPFNVLRLPDGLRLDLEGFSRVVRWEGRDKRNLDRYILRAFEPVVKARPGYTDEKRPEEPVEDEVKIGEVVFVVTTTPTKKRPSYKYVVSDFEDFLTGDMERYRQARLRSGFRTLRNRLTEEQEHYLPLFSLITRIEDAKEASLEGKDGISQSVDVKEPEELMVCVPDEIGIVSERDYGAWTEANAKAYVEGGNLAGVNDAAIRGFRAELLDDTLKKFGEEPKRLIGVCYAFDSGVFIHQVEPRISVSYGDIVNGFNKSPPKRITTKSRIGDLRLLELVHGNAEQMLRDKKLVDDKFLQIYDMQPRDGKPYVRIAGVVERLAYHRAACTESTVEQNIIMQPPYFAARF